MGRGGGGGGGGGGDTKGVKEGKGKYGEGSEFKLKHTKDVKKCTYCDFVRITHRQQKFI